jgi:hypothetical protein
MLLWLLLGFLIGAAAMLMIVRPEIKVAWFDWIILFFAVVFILFGIANYIGSMEELEPRQAWFTLVSFGLPGLILAAIVAVRIVRNRVPA